MEKIITATEAVRDFATILNKIKFSGENYMIKRSGKPMARMIPVKDENHLLSLKELKTILKQLPVLSDELDSFSKDLNLAINNQPEIQDELNWE
jgi:antitoxin (DNA-binding transcriptional repressor) of toxin-antitoxin stability system